MSVPGFLRVIPFSVIAAHPDLSFAGEGSNWPAGSLDPPAICARPLTVSFLVRVSPTKIGSTEKKSGTLILSSLLEDSLLFTKVDPFFSSTPVHQDEIVRFWLKGGDSDHFWGQKPPPHIKKAGLIDVGLT